MHAIDNNEQQAISRLFDLVRDGRTQDIEFDQLDLLVYERLSQTYRVDARDDALRVQTAA